MNILPPLPLIDGCLFVDNSGWIEPLCTCHRFAQYRNLNGRIAAGEKAALNFGSAVHLALEHRYKTYLNEPVDDQYYNDIGTKLTEFFEAHPTPADDWRTLNLAMEIVRRYNKRYDREAFNLLVDKDNKPFVELPFAVELFFINLSTGQIRLFAGDRTRQPDEILVIYSGRIDLPVSLDGQIYVLDFKTTSMLGTSFFDGKRLSSQPRGYAWAFERATGNRVNGYIIRGIRSKEVPQYVQAGKERTYKGERLTPDKWWQDSLAEERYILKRDEYCDELKEWEQNTICLLEEFFWHYRRGYMPMRTGNEHACVNYGRCQYYDVCRLASQDRGVMLSSGLFQNNDWSPLHGIKKA